MTDARKKGAAAAAQAADEMPQVEKAVLACALLDAKCAALLVNRGVRMDWFHDTRSRELCVRILDAIAAGRPVEPVALAVELQQAGKSWGVRFVEELTGMDCLPSHAEYYVGRLADARFRDEALRLCEEATRSLEAGEERADDAVSRLSEGVVQLLRWHTDGTESTPHALRLEQVEEFHQAHQDVMDGKPPRSFGLSWCIPGMDRITQGMYPGLHVIAARPSFGKTMLENFIATRLLLQGRRVARACLDMTPRALSIRSVTMLGGESLSRLRVGFMSPSDESKLRAVTEATRLWHERILTETTAEGIVSRARAIKAADGLDLLTVDYVQLVGTTDTSKFLNDNMVVSRAMKAFKAFANDTGTPVILLSQLSRAVEKEDRAPQLSDLRDSGSIEQDAKTVTFVYPEPGVMQRWMSEQGVLDWKALPVRPGILNVLKNQDGATGSVGVRQFARYGIYEEAARLTRDEMDAHRRARTAAADAAALKHRAVAAAVPASVGAGHDFAREAPDAPRYAVCRHPKGAFEVFLDEALPAINAAALRLGAEPWNKLDAVRGLLPALSALADARRRHNQAPPDAEELVAAAHMTAAAPAPSAPPPETDADPGCVPDPDDPDANPALL